MNKQNRSQQATWVVMFLFLLVGCGSPPYAPTSEASPEPAIEVGDVVFDGTDCTVSGPTEFLPGRYSFVLRDFSELSVTIFLWRLIEGSTFQDLLDLQTEPGEYVGKPDWVRDVPEPGSSWSMPDGGEVHTYVLTAEGEYAVSLSSWETPTSPLSFWFCAPFWVIED